jgi:histidyl-tRNA synthetase
VCAGGRYDGLVEYLGGRATAAIGFALGMERLVGLLESQDVPVPDRSPHLYVVVVGEQAQRHGLLLSERLRDALPQLRVVTHCGGGSFKSQFKKADRSGARYALVLGDEEVNRREVGIKPLREDREQETVSFDALHTRVAHLLELV